MKRKSRALGNRVEYGGGFGQCGHLHFAPDVPRPWVELSEATLQTASSHPLLRGIFPSRSGYFPRATRHRVHRPDGAHDTIFNYCVKGTGWCELEKRRFEVVPGDLLVIPAGVSHSYGSYEKRPWTIHWFHAMGEHLPLLMERLPTSRAQPLVHLGIDTQLIGLCQELRLTLEDDLSFSRLLYATQLLSHILGRMIRRGEEKHGEIPDAVRRVFRSVEYIKQHVEEAPEVEALAAVANLSTSYYATLFRQTMGCSPRHYAVQLRMKRAAQLLATTEYNVRTVAHMLGYNDALYFSRRFSLTHNVSPTQFRRKLANARNGS